MRAVEHIEPDYFLVISRQVYSYRSGPLVNSGQEHTIKGFGFQWDIKGLSLDAQLQANGTVNKALICPRVS